MRYVLIPVVVTATYSPALDRAGEKDIRVSAGQIRLFNTGLEMQAIKRHVREMESLYGVTITEYRPKKNIVQATREYGQPFVSKIMSAGLEGIQKKNIPLSIHDEYINAEDKAAKRGRTEERYPGCESTLILCCCNSAERAAKHTACN